MKHFLFTSFLIVVASSSLSARTWYIKPDGTGDAPTIQAGIDSSAAGDTVLVACGTYYEHDIIMKSGVCLKSETSSPECVTIDIQQQGKGIICELNNAATVIEGLTLANGSDFSMYCTGSDITARNCVFAYNKNPAVRITYCSPTFYNCIFYGNYSSDSWPSATIVIGYAPSAPTFSHCTFAENSAGISLNLDAMVDIENSIIAFCTDGFAIGDDEMGFVRSLICSNLFGNPGGYPDSAWVDEKPDCFSADPQFCGVLGSHNYYLQSDSPCAPGNHPNQSDCGLIGALPVICGITDVKNARSWGEIKSMYKESE